MPFVGVAMLRFGLELDSVLVEVIAVGALLFQVPLLLEVVQKLLAVQMLLLVA